MIGDSQVDVMTARNAGALSIGCTFDLFVPPGAPADRSSDDRWGRLALGRVLQSMMETRMLRFSALAALLLSPLPFLPAPHKSPDRSPRLSPRLRELSPTQPAQSYPTLKFISSMATSRCPRLTPAASLWSFQSQDSKPYTFPSP